MKPLRIGLIGYDGIQALDLVGPADAFTIAQTAVENGQSQPCYEVVVLGLTSKPFRAESGLVFQPHATLNHAPPLDTLVIPGGKGTRVPAIRDVVSRFVASRASRIRRIATVCTGIYMVGPTGLLDGRTVTTHWRFAADVARRFPKLNVNHDALFLKDGPFYTSGGITASIDLSLALIEEDYGPRVALSVARDLVVYLKRSGGQKQYSEPLEFQINSTDRFAELAIWMVDQLRENLSLDALAKRACLSPRHFVRRFKQAFGGTPAAFVENLRLDEARRRLSERTQTIETVAGSVGFHSDDSFRRAFQRRFGVNPSNYRTVFNARPVGLRNGGSSSRRSPHLSRVCRKGERVGTRKRLLSLR
jgi:transcriptional regulator GlxA family with amidase domain